MGKRRREEVIGPQPRDPSPEDGRSRRSLRIQKPEEARERLTRKNTSTITKDLHGMTNNDNKLGGSSHRRPKLSVVTSGGSLSGSQSFSGPQTELGSASIGPRGSILPSVVPSDGTADDQDSYASFRLSPDHELSHPTIDDDAVDAQIAIKMGNECGSIQLKIFPSEDGEYSRITKACKEVMGKSFGGWRNGGVLQVKDGECVISSVDSSFENRPMRLQSQGEWNPIKQVLLMYQQKGFQTKLAITQTYESTEGSLTSSVKQNPRQEADWFRGELKNMRLRAAHQRCQYIPSGDLEEFISLENIRKVIDEDQTLTGLDKATFANNVYSKASKLFAICVFAQVHLIHLMELMDNGYDDLKLPLGDCPDFAKAWPADPFEDLWSDQFLFLAPVFSTNSPHLEHHPLTPIPLIIKDDCGTGSYSKVYKILIHPSHQNLYSLENVPNPPLALKVLNRGHEFTNEKYMLEELRKLRHLHIVRLLFTYKHDETYHLIFPFANTSLRHYMADKESHKLEKGVVVWILKQFLGLAHALCTIHNYKITDPVLRDKLGQINKIERTNSDVMSPEEEVVINRTGNHHDLKPDNILHFGAAERGVFQIADFGLSQFHTMDSGSANHATHRGTPAYCAPEAKNSPTDSQPHVSRPYDVWSLGCIFLEVLVWLLEKRKGWGTFSSDRVETVRRGSQGEQKDDAFFIIEDGKAKVRDSVRRWIEKLRKHPACQGKFGLNGAVTLIEEMLEVNPSARIRTNRCVKRLNIIVKHAEDMDPVAFLSQVDSVQNEVMDGRQSPRNEGGNEWPVVNVVPSPNPAQSHSVGGDNPLILAGHLTPNPQQNLKRLGQVPGGAGRH